MKGLFELKSELAKFTAKTANLPTDQKEISKLEKKGLVLLQKLYAAAGKLCVDEELDAEFWKVGKGFSVDVPIKILQTVLTASATTGEQIRKFRSQRPRAKPI